MRRWNGWGDDLIEYPLLQSSADFLEALVGSGTVPEDISLQTMAKMVPDSRLPRHPQISPNPVDRLRHARGQSFPDWLSLRSGRIDVFPDGVAFPTSEADIPELIEFAKSTGSTLIPYGGGTSVVGHINPLASDRPVLTVDMGRLNRIIGFDDTSQLATFEAGIAGPDLEAQLRARGFTLGHYPQSFEYSTLGGWIATRSSGQQSLRYGRIEALFAGGKLVSPAGRIEFPVHPASAAGPDLKELVLGSEGRLGIITQATVRIMPLPERENFHAIFFPGWEQGFTAVREIVQSRYPLSMLRYSTPTETQTTLSLAGHERVIGVLEGLLAVRGAGDGKCMLLVGFTGTEAQVKFCRTQVLAIASRSGGIHVGRTFGSQWHKGRFKTPYLRNTLWQMGYGIDTLETAVPWVNVQATIDGIEAALHTAVARFDERAHVFTHLSHLYPHGSSIYVTYIFRLAPDPQETLERWTCMKTAASQVILTNGGTISHQHGVGIDHANYLQAEKGGLGIATIQDICRIFDPIRMMNPGKLVP
jgi:alkyldihydroxyacetonephosphate synthase